VDALMHSCFEPLANEMVERVVASGAYYCPTLSVFENALEGIEGRYDRDPRYSSLVSRRVARNWAGFCEEYAASGDLVPSGIAAGLPKARGREALGDTRGNFKLLVDAGVPVVFGTDASYGFCLLGRPVDEFVAMQAAGMPAVDCLKSATSTAAEMLSLEGRGVLREGARADMVVFDAGTVEDISGVEDTKAVVRAGRVMEDSPGVAAVRACRTALAVSRGMGRTVVHAVTNRP